MTVWAGISRDTLLSLCRLLFSFTDACGKWYFSHLWGYLYFTIHIVDNFYFHLTTFLKKIRYFLLHTFSLTLKSTRYILNGPIHTLIKRTSLVIPTASDLTHSIKHQCFICKLLCWSVPLAIRKLN